MSDVVLDGHTAIQLTHVSEPPDGNPPLYDGWRVLHKYEGGYDRTKDGMPSVLPPYPERVAWMTREIQEMSRELMRYFNPSISDKQWNRCHSHDRAFNNGVGFPNANGGDPRRDYINGTDLKAELPGYDKAMRLCGGLFVRGDVVGDVLRLTAGVHGIDASRPLPSIDEIVKNQWYVYGLNVGKNGGYHWDQGNGGAVVFPLIFTGTIEFPLVCFERWQSNELPDPLRLGG